MDEHKPGCPAEGGYGHGKEPCICGASLLAAVEDGDEIVRELWELECGLSHRKDIQLMQRTRARIVSDAQEIAALKGENARLAAELTMAEAGRSTYRKSWQDAKAERDALKAELASVKAERDGLVMAVAKKNPGETRYQTALRYINQAEAQGNDAGQCAAHPKE